MGELGIVSPSLTSIGAQLSCYRISNGGRRAELSC